MTATAPTLALQDRLEAAWKRSDLIFSLLDREALYQRPAAE